MSVKRQNLGRRGEKIAEEHLHDKGYHILHRHYRAGRKEIDLIARDGSTIVFIEVKTAATDTFGPPELWVTPRKQQALVRAARGFLARHDCGAADYRFDVIGVTLDTSGPSVQHIEGAFVARY